jgi:hypothetical protein
MAFPPDSKDDESMLEVEVANIRSPITIIHHQGSAMNSDQVLPLFGTNGHAPITISMTHEEYPSRPTRESVLQRLSEALLRRSLTKVGGSQTQDDSALLQRATQVDST